MIEFPNTSGLAPASAEPGTYGIAPPGQRLPATTRPGRVRLQVADLARSLAFYRDLLGFRALEHSGDSAHLGPAGDGAPLIELHERPGAAAVPRRGRLGLYHVALLLPDRASLGSFVEHLAGAGVRPGAADHLVSESLYLYDPDGLGIEVYADRPAAVWRRRGRELLLDTLQLDLPGVLQAAGGGPWSGMPPGTRVGHVHLSVGDLETAARFFHAALGLDIMVWSYPGALFLSAGGYHHHLGVNTWAGPDAPLPRPGDARLLEWELVVPGAGDLAAAVRSLEAGGYQVTGRDGQASATDPWGTVLRLLSAARRG